MEQILGRLGALGVLIFIFLVIVLPISVYAAQKWAYKCFLELKKLNKNIESLLISMKKD